MKTYRVSTPGPTPEESTAPPDADYRGRTARRCVIPDLPYGSVFRRRRTLKLRTCLIVLAMASTTTAGMMATVGIASAETAGERTAPMAREFTGSITGHTGSAWGGQCVDVAWSRVYNDTPIQMWSCNGSSAQRWKIHADGTIRPYNNGNKCMDVTGRSTANGAKVLLWDCHGGANQKWDKLYDPPGGVLTPAPW